MKRLLLLLLLIAPPSEAAALKCSTATTYVTVADSASIGGLTNVSYVMWLTLTANTSSTATGIFWKGTNAGGSQGDLTIGRAGGAIPNRGALFYQYNTTSINLNTGSAMVLNHPYFLVGTIDGTAKAGKLYQGDSVSPPTDVTTGTAAGVGTHNSDVGTSLYLCGDSVITTTTPINVFAAALYGSVLSLRDVEDLWRNFYAPVGAGSLKARWTPGSNGAGRVWDESGNTNHGTITSAIPIGDILPRLSLQWRRRP